MNLLLEETNRDVKHGNRCDRGLDRQARESRMDRDRGEETGIKKRKKEGGRREKQRRKRGEGLQYRRMTLRSRDRLIG